MALDAAKHVAYWRDGAQEALETAQLLIDSRRYLFGLFLGHLALEKLLKALCVRRWNQIPPRTHNLLALADLAQLTPPQALRIALGELQVYCMAGRYPDSDALSLRQVQAQAELRRIDEVYQWLRRQLNNA